MACERYKYAICKKSTYKGKYKKPCNYNACKHHIDNVLKLRYDVEYSILKREDVECELKLYY